MFVADSGGIRPTMPTHRELPRVVPGSRAAASVVHAAVHRSHAWVSYEVSISSDLCALLAVHEHRD